MTPPLGTYWGRSRSTVAVFERYPCGSRPPNGLGLYGMAGTL